MKSEEIVSLMRDKIHKTYVSPTTRKQYVGAVTRLLNRVPVEFFGDETVMRLYRQLLSSATRSIFGVIWKKLHDELIFRDMPCVPPERLIYRVRLPMIAGWPLERLSITTSTAAMATMMWTDVRVDEGTIYIRGIPLDKEEEGVLESVADYFWPGEVPPPTAPIIPLSRTARTIFMPPEMVEDAINDRHEERRNELEELAYDAYDILYANRYSLAKIEEHMEDLDNLHKLSRHYKAQAKITLAGAIRILQVSHDRETFDRVWRMGIDGREMYVQDAMKMNPPPPSSPPIAPKKPVIVPTGNANWSLSVDLAIARDVR